AGGSPARVSLARPARPRESVDPAPAAGVRASWSEVARVFRPLLPLYGLDILTSFTVGVVPPLLPLLAAHWDLSAVAAALLNTVYAIGRLPGSAPASRLRASLGTRAAAALVRAGLA